MTHPKPFARLRELLEKATPGPWKSDYCGDVWTEAIENPKDIQDYEGRWKSIMSTRTGPDNGDAELICELRNNAEKLLEALDEAESCLIGYSTCDDEPEAPINQAAQKALAKIRKLTT